MPIVFAFDHVTLSRVLSSLIIKVYSMTILDGCIGAKTGIVHGNHIIFLEG